MIKIKTDSNSLKEIKGVRVKTAFNALTKVAKGYQIVSVNGVPTLIPVFLSECKHDWQISDERSWGASCTEDGYNVWICSKCGEEYSEISEVALGHEYAEGFCIHCGEECHHEGYDTYLEDVTPHCTEALVQNVYCCNCGGIVGEGYVEPTGEHEYDSDDHGHCNHCGVPNWTCECGYDHGDFTEDGYGNWICDRCGGLNP